MSKEIIKNRFIIETAIVLLLVFAFALAIAVLHRQNSKPPEQPPSTTLGSTQEISGVIAAPTVKHANPTIVFTSELSHQALQMNTPQR